MREVSVTQLPIETIVAPVDKSVPTFDLQTDIIFGVNGGAKVNKFIYYIKSIVIGHNPKINTKYFVLASFTAKTILID